MKIDQYSSQTIDIAKFIGITLVVFGHLPGGYYAYYFHMPFFFFISGVTLSYQSPVKKGLMVLLKTYKYIIISYIVIGIISISLGSYLKGDYGVPFKNGIVDSISYAFKSNFHNNSLFLVCWFLVCYSIAYFMSAIVLYLSKEKKILGLYVSTIAAVVIGLISVKYFSPKYWEGSNQAFNLLSQVFYASMFMILGKSYGIRIINAVSAKFALISLLILGSLILSKMSLPIGMSWSKYPSGFLLSTICAMLSIIICLYSCRVLNKILSSRHIKTKSILINIGKSSKHIMTYHLLVFVIIDIAASFIGLWDLSKTSALNHFGGYVLLPVYVSLGVLVPYVVSIIFNKKFSH